MATKEDRRQAKGLVETLESRLHTGSPVGETDILSAREFLRERDFSSSSDYFNRLAVVQDRVATRPALVPAEKRNYGGQAGGCWMQVQSIYDHVILSTCYAGEFNTRRGRVKISHRFNLAGRLDFVELKFLNALQPDLNGGIRKLVMIQNFQSCAKEWYEAEAFALRILPQELVFVYGDLFRSPREEVLAWLVNIGHWSVGNMLRDLRDRTATGVQTESQNPNQLPLDALLNDEVAMPILEQAENLECMVDLDAPEAAIVRYYRR